MSNEEVAPLMAFTGPAGRTRWDENGALKTVGQNELREDYCPRTGRYRGVLIEQEAENYVLAPNDFSSWTAISNGGGVGPTVESGRVAGPDGQNSAFRCHFELSGQGYSLILSPTLLIPINARISVFARLVSGGVKNLCIYSGGGNARNSRVTTLYSGQWVRAWAAPSDSGDSTIKLGLASFAGLMPETLEVDIWWAQCEVGRVSSPFSGVRARDDARFTDPAIFGNFERGTFVVEFETANLNDLAFVLSRGGRGRFLNINARPGVGNKTYSYSGDNINYNDPMAHGLNRFAVSWGGQSHLNALNGGRIVETPWDGTWDSGDLVIGAQNWSGWIRRMPFNAENLTGEELQRLTAVPRRTTIASGTILGDYDPNERLSLFKDRHGIHPVERDGDPVRFMLDLGPMGHHLQAAPESTGLIYRTDGQRSWIEYNGVNDYFVYRAGPILRGNISVSAHVALQLAVDKPAGSQLRVLIAQGTPVDSSLEFSVGHYQNGPDTCWFSVGQPAESRVELALSNIQRGRWTVFWADIEQGIRSVYQDGQSVGSSANPLSGGYLKGSQFRLGYDNNGRYWKGPMGRVTLTADADQADRGAIDAEIIGRYVSA